MRFLLATLVLAAVSLPSTASAACNWPDGPDSAAPPADGGRGIMDWRAHFDYAKGNGFGGSGALVGARVGAIKGCLDAAAFTRLYADASILIGAYGRAGAGWKDGADPSAPPDDGGRGITNWEAHRSWASSNSGQVEKLIGDRMRGLSGVLAKDTYARLYADLSVLLVNYAHMR